MKVIFPRAFVLQVGIDFPDLVQYGVAVSSWGYTSNWYMGMGQCLRTSEIKLPYCPMTDCAARVSASLPPHWRMMWFGLLWVGMMSFILDPMECGELHCQCMWNMLWVYFPAPAWHPPRVWGRSLWPRCPSAMLSASWSWPSAPGSGYWPAPPCNCVFETCHRDVLLHSS